MKLTIKEIKEKLQQINDRNHPLFNELAQDERKGVQTALKQWEKRQMAAWELSNRYLKMNAYEDELIKAEYQWIAGIDEVGRGPLAGPVVSAAVILDPKQQILGLNDSKKLSLSKRTQLYKEINEKAVAVGVGIVNAEEIDQLNILQATKLSMTQAISQLTPRPDFLLIDAETIDTTIPQQAVIKGDLNSNSIAAASIVAKVTRDLLMEEYDETYPGYSFASNVGYGTKEHLEGLKNQGPTPIHRKSFAPVKNYFK